MRQSVSYVHLELYHYTTTNGLKGIIENQTLWATHHAHLNDHQEIIHFKNRLPEIIEPAVEEIMQIGLNAIGLNNDETDKKVKSSKEAANSICDHLYNTTFVGRNGKPPFVEPYFTSFCTVDQNWKDEKKDTVPKHGLLSQWRGYGKNGGYAIVFDTSKIEELLKEENEKWHYQNSIYFCDVLYSNTLNNEILKEFGEDEKSINEGFKELIFRQLGKTDAQVSEMYEALCKCACRYKHWGFEEEQEVRIIAIPASQEVRKSAGNEKNTLLKPEKPINHFMRSAALVPHIDLFDEITVPRQKILPIKRIIVGPHPDKEKRRRSVELLLRRYGVDAEVLVSEIPYIEMG